MIAPVASSESHLLANDVKTLSPTRIDKRESFALYHGDCVEVLKGFPDGSVDLIVSSPPFPSMYVYNNTPRDIGNTRNPAEMLGHFRFLVDELLRVIAPGRTCCVHLTQVPRFKSEWGDVSREDFRGDVIRLFMSCGWLYASEVLIDKCPQIKAQRTKDRGLLFKSLATDSSIMAPVMADYVLFLRKPGDNARPIRAGKSPKYKNEDGWITGDEWIEWAAAVWYRRVSGGRGGLDPCGECDEGASVADFSGNVVGKSFANVGHPSRFQSSEGISETDVIRNFRDATTDEDEKHICPLQLSVIERCVKLWSNPGEVVLDPFGGVGSTPYQAVKLKRKGVAIELKESYYKQAVTNCEAAVASMHDGQVSFFDMLEAQEGSTDAAVEDHGVGDPPGLEGERPGAVRAADGIGEAEVA